MAEIGSTLRETRMRERIDIAEVESATKIRAKYLRALENEEWDLLPGPTFVKTFLRTYAEYLGIEAKPLIEEYKQRYERPSATELHPFGTGLDGHRDRRRGPPTVSPAVALAVGAVLLVGALWAIGSLWPQDGGEETEEPNRVARQTATPEPRRTPARQTATRPRVVSLQVLAEGTVYVCLIDAAGRRVLDGITMQAGQKRGPYRGRRFRVTFGNGAGRMRVNGRFVNVPNRTTPVGYELTPGKRRELGENRRPTCA